MSEKTFLKHQRRFEKFAFLTIGSRPIAKVTAPEFLTVLKAVEARGNNETAYRFAEKVARSFGMSSIPAAPNATSPLTERRKMMQEWAD